MTPQRPRRGYRSIGLLPDKQNCGLRMRRQCRERFPLPQRVSDPDMYHGTCVTHVPWCMPGSLTSGFLLRWWRGNRFRHSRRMRNPQSCVSGKRPIENRWKDMSTLVFSTVPVGDLAPFGTTITADTVWWVPHYKCYFAKNTWKCDDTTVLVFLLVRRTAR